MITRLHGINEFPMEKGDEYRLFIMLLETRDQKSHRQLREKVKQNHFGQTTDTFILMLNVNESDPVLRTPSDFADKFLTVPRLVI